MCDLEVTEVTHGNGRHKKLERWDMRPMSQFDDLVSKVFSSKDSSDSESLAELIREFGACSANAEEIRSVLHELGYADTQLEDVNEMAKVAQDFLASMPDETRDYIMNMAMQAVSGLNLGKVPPELERLLGNCDRISEDPGKSEDET